MRILRPATPIRRPTSWRWARLLAWLHRPMASFWVSPSPPQGKEMGLIAVLPFSNYSRWEGANRIWRNAMIPQLIAQGFEVIESANIDKTLISEGDMMEGMAAQEALEILAHRYGVEKAIKFSLEIDFGLSPHGNVLDINEGGFSFLTHQGYLWPGLITKAWLELPEGETIWAEAVIRAIHPEPHCGAGLPEYRCGVQLRGISEAIQRKILQYVRKRELEEFRRKRGQE